MSPSSRDGAQGKIAAESRRFAALQVQVGGAVVADHAGGRRNHAAGRRQVVAADRGPVRLVVTAMDSGIGGQLVAGVRRWVIASGLRAPESPARRRNPTAPAPAPGDARAPDGGRRSRVLVCYYF